MKSIFEQMGGTYTKVGDYDIPDIAIPEVEEKPLGKYGRLRRTFLEEHRAVRYNHLVLTGKLYPDFYDVDEQAQQMLDTIIPQMMQLEGVTEGLKATDQMEWVGRMNNIKARVDEIIFSEIIYI